jgi:predicted alpha/beta-fold hydrolase
LNRASDYLRRIRRTTDRVFFFALLCVFFVGGLTGCFGERSFPMVPERLTRLGPQASTLPTREWVKQANAAMAFALPPCERVPLTTDDFLHEGRVTNVYRYFDINPAHVDSLLRNLDGLEQTSEVSAPPSVVDQKGHLFRPAWAGFSDVEIPVGNGITLYGRIGAPDLKDPGVHEIPGSFIVITHGLFGSLDGLDMANEVEALRRAGHHVLAMEMRGHGETNAEHPEYAVSFGINESADLLAVAQWLKTQHHATRVGLVSFSLTGYEALLTAWLDGTHAVTRFDRIPLLRNLPRHMQQEPAFNAGMFIVSPPVDLMEVADRFDTHYNLFTGPCKALFQRHVAERMALIQQAPSYSLWAWAASEFRRTGWEDQYPTFAALKVDLVRFLNLRTDDWAEGARRMENIRVPVLILASANDPLGTAQGVSDLFARVKNPNIGVVMLQQGGHMGFPALSADYYYSLMLNFFDPKTGPKTE